jgi:hypothetical protein
LKYKLLPQIGRKSVYFLNFMAEERNETLTAKEKFAWELHDGPIGSVSIWRNMTTPPAAVTRKIV